MQRGGGVGGFSDSRGTQKERMIENMIKRVTRLTNLPLTDKRSINTMVAMFDCESCNDVSCSGSTKNVVMDAMSRVRGSTGV